MNLAELRNAARLRLDDTDSNKYGWSDAELDSFINEAVDEACIRARLNLDSTSAEATTVSVVAGTASYLLHESVLRVERAYLNTSQRTLSSVSFQDLDILSDTWPVDTGTPTNYIPDLDLYSDAGTATHKITLYPIPEVTETLKLTVYRLPLCPLTSDSEEPEIHPLHHPSLLDWVCHKAYTKQDADTLDIEKSLQYEGRFTDKFGPRPSARQLSWRQRKRPQRVPSRFI